MLLWSLLSGFDDAQRARVEAIADESAMAGRWSVATVLRQALQDTAPLTPGP